MNSLVLTNSLEIQQENYQTANLLHKYIFILIFNFFYPECL